MQETLLRLPQIIGSERATPKRVPTSKAKLTNSAEPPKQTKPRVTERHEYTAIVPVSKSAWWAGVKAGIYPQPLKLSARTTVWRASEVYALAAA